jgi:hypothetical protein
VRVSQRLAVEHFIKNNFIKAACISFVSGNAIVFILGIVDIRRTESSRYSIQTQGIFSPI